MFVIKNYQIINIDHVLRIEVRYHDPLENDEGHYVLDFFYSNDKKTTLFFSDEYQRDLAFLSIIQSISQGITTCYLDSDISKYQVSNSANILPTKKKCSKVKK